MAPALGIAFALWAPAPARPQVTPVDTAWRGRYVIHHLARPIGEERDQLAVDRANLTLSSTLEYTDRGGRVELQSSLRLQANLAPTYFKAQGRTYRFVNLDTEVDVRQGVATIHSLGETTTHAVPSRFFVSRGYAPLAARALLIAYWERHGRPEELPLLPDGQSARVAFRGTDTIRVGDRSFRLRRFSVEGVVWGREAVWLDEHDRLAALLTRIHILPLEAVRDDLVEALPALQALAVQDRLADLSVMASRAKPIAQGSFALVGARLIDGNGGAPIDDATMVVRDGLIVAVGARPSLSVPEGVEVIKAEGRTIVPGLWDMHGHLSQIEWAPAYLAAGVTTARDVGGERGFLTSLRGALAKPEGLGLRLLLAGLVDGGGPDGYGTTIATTPAEGRATVDTFKAASFDQMKLYSQLAPEVVTAITARAHALGMTVTGHIPRALSFREAIESGMDQFEHLAFRQDPGSAEARALARFLAERGTVAGPTLAWDELLGRAPETSISTFEPGILEAPIPLVVSYESVRNDVDRETARASRRRGLGLLKELHEAGVPIVAGTDGAVPGHSLLRTLELFVEAGMTPAEAIASATSLPAHFMKMDTTVGTLEAGKRADFLVLDADPLADISNLRKGRWVAAGGRMYDCAALWRVAGFRKEGS